jgi:ferritin
MLSQAMRDALNHQIQHDLYSSYLYLAMAAQFEAANLAGFAHWMKKQSGEETGHGMKFWEYIIDQGGKVSLGALAQPPAEFGTPSAVFKAALEHEKKITGLINGLYALALKENDYAAQIMLQWFINEQVEEEKNATQIIEQLKLLGEQGTALYMMDRALAAR